MMYTITLWIHIAAGIGTLLGAAGAILTKIFSYPHQWHVYSGRLFYYGMVVVFITSLIMTSIRPNIFLFLISIFSFYLAFTGWRSAVNRFGIAGFQDYISLTIMGIAGLGMLITGINYLIHQNDQGVTLLIFGLIGISLSGSQTLAYRKKLTGVSRINDHIRHMMAATIAAITAFLVTNLQSDPEWIAWIAPTIVMTPLIPWFIIKKEIRN